ncbi:MAG: phosphoribosylformylglycinamidine cyclo-ligase [Pseudomonadota bacterium]
MSDRQTTNSSDASDAYKKAGVDIDAGNALVERIKPLVRATMRPGADGDLGGFGGLFDLKAAGYSDPILVAGADGVGTKLKIAIDTGMHSTIGIDLVAMCANDVLAQGAAPLFFLDYFATGNLDNDIAAQVIEGIATGCKDAGCALIGGETAEMPGLYQSGDYDLAGFCVGAVERDKRLPRTTSVDDVMIGLGSSGPHANGYSLIRRIIEETGLNFNDKAPFDANHTLGMALLAPTRLYIKSVHPLFADTNVKAFAHITGGGLTENVPRVLSKGCEPHYDESALPLPPVFQWLQEAGSLSDRDMRRTFNCGIGGVLIVAPESVDSILAQLRDAGEAARIIGHLHASAASGA